jgi:hypothetical protein
MPPVTNDRRDAHGVQATSTVRPSGTGHPYPATAAMVVGDFNGDPHADLAVVVNSSDGVAVLLGKADGSFTCARGSRPTCSRRGWWCAT